MFLLSALSITLPNTPTVRHTECPFSRDDQAGSFVTLTTAQRGVLAPPQRPTTGDTWKAMAAEGETVGQGQHRALFHSPSASLSWDSQSCSPCLRAELQLPSRSCRGEGSHWDLCSLDTSPWTLAGMTPTLGGF